MTGNDARSQATPQRATVWSAQERGTFITDCYTGGEKITHRSIIYYRGYQAYETQDLYLITAQAKSLFVRNYTTMKTRKIKFSFEEEKMTRIV